MIQTSTKSKRYFLLSNINRILLVMAAILFVLNQFLRESLFSLSLQKIAEIQKETTQWTNIIIAMISLICEPIAIYPIIAYFTIKTKIKHRSFYLLTVVCLSLCIMGITKSLYCDPRPIWTSYRVYNLGAICPGDFGNPSGHSLFAAVMGFVVYLQFYCWRRDDIGIVVKVAVVGLLCVLVPFSRVYLGYHSINQVLEGLFIGMLIIAAIKVNKLDSKVKSIVLNPSEDKSPFKLFLLILTIDSILAYFFSIYLYYSNEQSAEYKQWNSLNMLKCKGKSLWIDKTLFKILVANLMFIGFLGGLFVGGFKASETSQGKAFMEGEWNYGQRFSRWISVVMRWGVEFACLSSGILLSYLILSMVGHSNSVVLVSYIFGAIISGLIYANSWTILFGSDIIQQEFIQ